MTFSKFSYPSMKRRLLFHLLSVILLTSPIDCNKVSLGLYYESLCPYSARFIIDSLDVIFSNGLIDIVDLKLVPWGNTKIYGTHTFKCQVRHAFNCFFFLLLRQINNIIKRRGTRPPRSYSL